MHIVLAELYIVMNHSCYHFAQGLLNISEEQAMKVVMDEVPPDDSCERELTKYVRLMCVNVDSSFKGIISLFQ